MERQLLISNIQEKVNLGDFFTGIDVESRVLILKTIVNFSNFAFYVFSDIAAKYPPSLRLVIQETDLNDKLKVGSLFIIPFTGGTLGREGTHDIIIPDVNISKTHLRFAYNTDKDRYECSDTGSRNGTLLNGQRMSETGVKSKRMALMHDSVIELNKTRILCHIHEGHTTCDKCEPGIIQKTREVTTAVAGSASMEVLSHKAALKQLQKRYGLENESELSFEIL